MYRGKLQVAVCQIECHPALKIGDIDYLCEPFLTSNQDDTLASILRDNLDLLDIAEECRDAYLRWHARRLKSIMEFLSQLSRIPDILIFPEGSIPYELLGPVREFAVQNKITVFAGTHTLSSSGRWHKRYRQLGIDTRTLKKWKRESYTGGPVLPIFHEGKSFFHRKLNPSIYETTDVGIPQHSDEEMRLIPLKIQAQKLIIAPLVCLEALRMGRLGTDYDAAVVCAFNQKTRAFDAFIEYETKNRRPVIFCNDGAFGGSGVFLPLDKRIKSWWWGEPHAGRVQQGDGIIVVELDFNNIAPQVGITNPKAGVELKLVAAITYEYERNSGYKTTELMRQIAEDQDNTVQAEVISQALSAELPVIQRTKLEHLYRLAHNMNATTQWWNILGRDCTIDGEVGLRGLEERLAEQFRDRLISIISSGEINEPAVLARMAKYVGICNKKTTLRTTREKMRTKEKLHGIINRDEESKVLIDFLGSSTEVICFVMGLNSVGKSSVISKAIAEAGHQSVFRVVLVEDTTPEFICASLLSQVGSHVDQSIDINTDKVYKAISTRLPRNSIFLIENAHYCLSHRSWRDEGFIRVFEILVDLGIEQKCKVIVETDIAIDFEDIEPNRIRRRIIVGLNPEYGTRLLKQHLCRAGLNSIS